MHALATASSSHPHPPLPPSLHRRSGCPFPLPSPSIAATVSRQTPQQVLYHARYDVGRFSLPFVQGSPYARPLALLNRFHPLAQLPAMATGSMAAWRLDHRIAARRCVAVDLGEGNTDEADSKRKRSYTGDDEVSAAPPSPRASIAICSRRICYQLGSTKDGLHSCCMLMVVLKVCLGNLSLHDLYTTVASAAFGAAGQTISLSETLLDHQRKDVVNEKGEPELG